MFGWGASFDGKIIGSGYFNGVRVNLAREG